MLCLYCVALPPHGLTRRSRDVDGMVAVVVARVVGLRRRPECCLADLVAHIEGVAHR